MAVVEGYAYERAMTLTDRGIRKSLIASMKLALAPLLYRFPPVGLQPSELGVYLTELLRRADVPGDIAEVGCSVGGTACVASALVRKWSPHKSYTCFDTFNGFVRAHLQKDAVAGTPTDKLRQYAANSAQLVRRVLDLHGGSSVRLIQGDIAELPPEKLSDAYSVVLMDVDLDEPTYQGLRKFWPRLSRGGTILVDDCAADSAWKARCGYVRFCEEMNIEPRFEYGFGIVERT